jgi:hypothetical protein
LIQDQGREDRGFVTVLANRLGKEPHQLTQEDRQKAVKGVQGMMRFADHDNPLLLEALGDLLVACHERPENDAKQLAARAYLAASYKMKDDAARLAYRKRAERALCMQTRPSSYDQLPLTDLEADFKAELIEANRWYAKLKESELAWVRDGKDADAEFDALYTAEPAALDTSNDPLLPWSVVIAGRVVAVLAVPVLAAFAAWWIWRRVVRA